MTSVSAWWANGGNCLGWGAFMVHGKVLWWVEDSHVKRAEV